MYEVNNNVAKIDGIKGKYDDKTVTNPSVRYGRNSVQNFYSYLEQPIVKDNNATPPILDFGVSPNAADNNIEKLDKYVKENDEYLKSLPPLEYEYRYMPNIHKAGKIDNDALLGASYEELGGRKEVSVKDLDQSFGLNGDFSSTALDLNKDGKIDVGEYGSSILAADMLSKPDDKIGISNIDGKINKQGHNAVQELTKKANAEAAALLYGTLYKHYNLADASKTFNPQ